MKKYFLSLGLLVAATFSLTNCTEQIEIPEESITTPFEVVASTTKTKTANNGLETVWTEGDALNIFHAIAGAETYTNDNKFTLSGENSFKGELTGTLIKDNCYDWYAFYPYKSQITTPANIGDSNSYSYTAIGSSASGTQTQIGNNSMAHIAGTNYPMSGILLDTEYESESAVEIEMEHLTSLIEFNITNNSENPLTVESINFTANEDIIGTYYINFVNPEDVVFTSSDPTYVSSVARLKVTDAEPIAVGGSAKFYMAVKPFTAKSGETLTLMINDCEIEKDLTSDITFNRGKIRKINCSYTTPVSALKGIEEIKEAADEAGASGGTFVADVENAIVTYVSDKNAFIEDETAGILIYVTGHGLEAGDKLSGRISGTVKVYNGQREITALTSSATVTKDNEIPVTTLTIDELNTNFDKYENMRVKLEGVEVIAGNLLSKDETTIAYYKKNSAIGFEEYNIVDAFGYPAKYNSNKQIQIWEDAVVKGATQTIFSGFNGNVEVSIGNTVTNAAVASSGATVSYTSLDTNIATVDANGVITGVAAGETQVIASVPAYNGYPAAELYCQVIVTSSTDPVDTYTIEWTANSEWVDNYQNLVKGYYTIQTAKSLSSTSPTVNATDKDCRVYAKGTITVSHAYTNMKELVFKISNNGKKRLANIVASEGTVVVDNENWTVTWTGDAKSVTFTVGDKATYGTEGADKAGQLCFDSIDATAVHTDFPIPSVLRRIEISGMTTEYTINSAFSFDGTAVAYYSDGQTKNVTPEISTAPDMTTSGVNKDVILSYTEGGVTVSASYQINVTDPSDDSVKYTLLFGTDYNSGNISAYDKTWSATNNEFTCDLANWNNNNNSWNYVKAGRKNNASVATITTSAAIPEAINTVTMTVDAVTTDKINSLKLYVSETSDFVSSTEYSTTVDTGDVTFNITTPVENAYYKIVVDCASGSSNGLITVSKVVFSE